MKAQLTPTKIVRQIMREHGKTMIYSNTYKTQRSVKCYAGRDGLDVVNTAMLRRIKRALSRRGVASSAKVLPALGVFRSDSIIVTLPL
jgi:hypothetical protein